ncbi:MAG: Txe/YoeB family addiction module toxin [Prevotellaceae bacterium]|jgi:toxin YoeB|nr:Txe/YoeB family addiction module toxin [Prevotellaceae bacterium]
MTYALDYTADALESLALFKKSNPVAHKKVMQLIGELHEHPRTGTGKPKQLSGNLAGCYARKITDKHRLVYEIYDDVVRVLVLSVAGHYNDK